MRVLVAIGIVALFGACAPKSVDQSPEKQAIADSLYAEITRGKHPDLHTGYSSLVGCIAWDGSRPVSYSALNAYYVDSGWAVDRDPTPDLRRSAMGDCLKEKKAEENCTCQVIAENGINMIKVP